MSLGVYLRKHQIETEIVEAGRYPKHKVCGEFICGVNSSVLEELGVQSIIAQSLEHRTMAWWMEGEKVLEDTLPTVAWGLSRYKIDDDLARLFEQSGGNLRTGERYMEGDLEGVVWGTGKRKKRGRWIGLKIHALNADVEGLEMHVGQRGYMGLCEVEGGRTNCCGLFRVDKSIKARGSEMVDQYLRANGLVALADRMSTWEKDSASLSATAGFSFGRQEQEGEFCVGDASYLIPPFTGNGMSMALESSWMAGKWLRRYAEEEIEWEQAVQGYNRECVAFFQKRMRISGTIQPLLFNHLGRSLLRVAATAGVLPFQFLFRQLRTP